MEGRPGKAWFCGLPPAPPLLPAGSRQPWLCPPLPGRRTGGKDLAQTISTIPPSAFRTSSRTLSRITFPLAVWGSVSAAKKRWGVL